MGKLVSTEMSSWHWTWSEVKQAREASVNTASAPGYISKVTNEKRETQATQKSKNNLTLMCLLNQNKDPT